MTPVEHLTQALVLLHDELAEVEHRMAYIRSAIEAFGLDPDDVLIVETDEDEPEVEVEVVDDEPCLSVYRVGREWNWPAIAALIKHADRTGESRVQTLIDELDVSYHSAQWMVKRCREKSLIDPDWPAVNERAARDAAAAAI